MHVHTPHTLTNTSTLSGDISACAQQRTNICSCTDGPIAECRVTFTDTQKDRHKARSRLREISLVHRSFTSPPRWLCLEDSQLRRRLWALWAPGALRSLLISAFYSVSESELCGLSVVPNAGSPGQTVWRGSRGCSRLGVAKRHMLPSNQNPALPGVGRRGLTQSGRGGPGT